jgi:MFS family permease
MEAADHAQRRPEAYLWFLVLFLTLAGTISYVDRQILALMIGPVKRDLGIGDTEVGLLIGLAFSLFYSAMMLPMAWLADTRSRRAVIGFGMAAWSLMTALSGLSRDYGHLFLARMGVGVGEAALNPAAFSLLADSAPRDRVPFLVGVFTAAPFIGIGLANIVGGALVEALEAAPPVNLPLVGELRSWQATFFVVGLPGAALSLLALLIREPPRPVASRPAEAAIAPVLSFLVRRRGVLALHFGGFTLLAIEAFMAFAWMAEFFIREHGLSRATVGQAYGLIALVFGLSGSVLSGALASAWMRRGQTDATLRLTLLAALAMTPLAIALPLAPRPDAALALLAVLTFFMAWPAGLGVAALQALAPSELRGRVVALYLLLINLVPVSLGPVLAGLVNDFVFGRPDALGESLLLLAAILYPLGALLVLCALAPFRRALEEAPK